MSLDAFAEKMKAERAHQADRWADGSEAGLDETDDRENSPMEFVGYMVHHATRWFNGGFKPWPSATLKTFQTQMVKVAATAYAAHEWAQRELSKREDL